MAPKLSWQSTMDVVEYCWREEFSSFVKTGEASDGFFEYLNSSAACQEALAKAFRLKDAGAVRLLRLVSNNRAEC